MNTDFGTIYKVNIHIEGIQNMDNVDFSCRVWTLNKSVIIPKSEMIRVDEENYVLIVDSSKVGRGTMKIQTTVMVPDQDIEGGFRKEIYTETTNIKIS